MYGQAKFLVLSPLYVLSLMEWQVCIDWRSTHCNHAPYFAWKYLKSYLVSTNISFQQL